MRGGISRAKSAEEGQKTMKFMPEAWGLKVMTTKDAVAIVERIGSHYVVTIMKRPTDLGKIFSLLNIHSDAFFSLPPDIFTQDPEGRRHAQGRDKKDS